MRHEDLRSILRREPFVPVNIRTASGDSFTVDHPENVLLPTNAASRLIAVYDSRRDLMTFVDLAMIESVTPGAGPNGSTN